MAFSLQIFVDNVCKSVLSISVGSEVRFKLVEKESAPPPRGVDVYEKCSEISPYMLFMKDIQSKYNLSLEVAKKKVADILWTTSPQNSQYHTIADEMKAELRRKKWLVKQPVNALSSETCTAVEEILRKLEFVG